MLQKCCRVILAVFLISAIAVGNVYADNAAKKLGRGVANIVTCPLELVSEILTVSHENGVIAGLTWGTGQGLVEMVKRGAVGVYETVTFPIPVPKHYEPILENPEFFGNGEIALFGAE